MNMMKRAPLWWLFMALPLCVYAQETQTNLEANFVSRIRVELEEGSVRLYWKDSPSPEIKTYQVYRSIIPFTKESLEKAELVARVDSGVEGYTDKPQQPGEYFYAVLGVKESGEIVKTFVPFRNYTSSPIAYTPPVPSGQVLNVSARVVSDRVFITFQATDATENVIIIRTTEYPETREALANGVMIATLPGTATTYQDLPPQGLPFYYTVVNARSYSIGQNLFSASNRTPDPVGVQLTQVQARPQVIGPQPFASLAVPEVEIILPNVSQLLAQRQRQVTPSPTESSLPTASNQTSPAPTISLLDLGYRERILRVLPLPRLIVKEDILTGNPVSRFESGLPTPRNIGPETLKILDNIAKGAPVPTLPGSVILPEEKTAASGLAERLSNIINSNWPDNNWSRAIQELTSFLQLEIDQKVKERAYFYRAQAYLFSGQRERSSMDFILALPSYRTQVSPFLDYLLLKNRN